MKAIYVIQGEVSLLLSVLRKTTKWASHARMEEEHDPLVHSLQRLYDQAMVMPPDANPDPNLFLPPFLEVIRNEYTSGQVTGMALSAINKFLAYGVIDFSSCDGKAIVSMIANALCHARFYGENPASDEVSLMKILQVLRTLLLSNYGTLLTDENVWEIMKACVNICFVNSLSELLRHAAFVTLDDMIQMLFSSLPSIAAKHAEQKAKLRETQSKQDGDGTTPEDSLEVIGNKVENDKAFPVTERKSTPDGVVGVVEEEEEEPPLHPAPIALNEEDQDTPTTPPEMVGEDDLHSSHPEDGESSPLSPNVDDFVNTQGVRFLQPEPLKDGQMLPYGLACVSHVTRYLATVIDPYVEKKSDSTILVGLRLISTAMECGAHHLSSSPEVLNVVRDDLCKNLFGLLRGNSVNLFSLALRNCFLLFESNREHMKFQFEMFFQILTDEIITSENSKMPYQKRELALETLVMLCSIPDLASELYVNYDCELYCRNVFESLAKTLSKNVFPSNRLQTTHLLSLQALLAIIGSIERSCSTLPIQERAWLEVSSEKHSGSKNPFSDSLEKAQSTHNISEIANSKLKTCKSTTIHRSISASPVFSGVREVQEPAEEGAIVEEIKLPSPDELMYLRQRKKLLLAGSDDFNMKASKGIKFLQSKGLIAEDRPEEIAKFLVDNPYLNKSTIGDYIGSRSHEDVLKAFVRQFQLRDTSLVDGLRQFLETFRLPGEAPIISRIMEHFAEHWLVCNEDNIAKGIGSKDAVYVLCYAILMLHTDQHNPQVRNRMTIAEFKKNQKGVNDGKDFPAELLEQTYKSVREKEFIMPDEHYGAVKENYKWKILLRRSSQSGADHYLKPQTALYHSDLYLILWGPAIAALSYVFENGVEEAVVMSAMLGFQKCAAIAAHYGLCDVFDNIIITLCKFTSLCNAPNESMPSAVLTLGTNPKAQKSAKVMFALAHNHGNILREGWKNILELLWHLFKAKLLPRELTESEDFIHSSGKISLYKEEPIPTKSDSGILSFFAYNWLISSEQSQSSKTPPQADGKALKNALKCVEDCHPELLFSESKFLKPESLTELIKSLTFGSQGIEAHEQLGTSYDEESAVFHLELLVSVVIENRDRIIFMWHEVSNHFTRIILTQSHRSYLKERGVVGLLKAVKRLISRDEVRTEVLSSLRIILALPLKDLPHRLLSQLSNGLHEVFQASVAHTKSSYDWLILMAVLEGCSAGVSFHPKSPLSSDTNLSHSSDDQPSEPSQNSSENSLVPFIPQSTDHLVKAMNNFDVWPSETLDWPHPSLLFKACETLAYLIRNERHTTKENFTSCIHAVRTLAEATSTPKALQHDLKRTAAAQHGAGPSPRQQASRGKTSHVATKEPQPSSPPTGSLSFSTITIQLLDLMHTLYSRVSDIFANGHQGKRAGLNPSASASLYFSETDKSHQSTGPLWHNAWCPLLQGMARMCCDSRRSVRHTAISYLQRALLAHDLQQLNPTEWEACFLDVFFPMLSRLLDGDDMMDAFSLEETRMRGAQLLSKVFLQHLSPLLKLKNFQELWLGILDVMEKYYFIENSESLTEAIPESLKNMLLVMSTAGLFGNITEIISLESKGDQSSLKEDHGFQLWQLSWQRIEKFLPKLQSEIFPTSKSSSVTSTDVTTPTDVPTSSGGTTTEQAVERESENGNSEQANTEKVNTPPSVMAATGEVVIPGQPVLISPVTVVKLSKPLPVVNNVSSTNNQSS